MPSLPPGHEPELEITNKMVPDTRPVFFFDVDDCLYPQNLGVDRLMEELITSFIMKKLNLTHEAATTLSNQYYQQYGLTIIGLQSEHNIDPLEFNREVDDKLPMHTLLTHKSELTHFFTSIDRTKVKLWLFTNAHINHGLRVVELLGLTRFFEGITYCDYDHAATQNHWLCKPSTEMLRKAEREAGVRPGMECFYVDDNVGNCRVAAERGWKVLWIRNDGGPKGMVEQGQFRRIRSLLEIPEVFPHFMAGSGVSVSSPRVML